MKLDDILGDIGEFGRYQRWVYAMVCFISLPVAWHQMAQVFMGSKMDHWCQVCSIVYHHHIGIMLLLNNRLLKPL